MMLTSPTFCENEVGERIEQGALTRGLRADGVGTVLGV